MKRSRISLKSWLVEAMTDTDKDGPIQAITLVHCVGEYHSKQTEVHAVRFGSVVWTEDQLSELFQTKAEHHCQAFRGSQLYKLLAFYGDKASEHGAEHYFRVQGGADEDAMISEPVNEQGMKAQFMRAFDVNSQIAWKASMSSIDQLLRMNEHLSETNMRLMNVIDRKNDMLERVFTKHLELEHEKRVVEIQEERKTMLYGKAMNLLPGVIEGATGLKLPGNSTESALLELVAQELTPEKVIALQQILSPETMAMLASKLVAIRSEQEKKKLTLVKSEENAANK